MVRTSLAAFLNQIGINVNLIQLLSMSYQVQTPLEGLTSIVEDTHFQRVIP
jgi:hypothetical protein